MCILILIGIEWCKGCGGVDCNCLGVFFKQLEKIKMVDF